MLKPLDLYLIPARNNQCILFSPPGTLHDIEDQAGGLIQRFLHWFMRRKNRFAAWVGGLINTGHQYYLKLEDRIDPAERVLKAMSMTEHLIVHHPRRLDAQVRSKFEAFLHRQRVKHIFWITIDFIVSAIALAFIPFLALLPGPNVFFYYPFLRLLSHYRALLGATVGLHSRHVEFKSLPDLNGLEDNLQGLRTFLGRVG